MASSSEDEDEEWYDRDPVLSVSDAAAVLAAVRGTRAARSKVDGAGTGRPLRAHRFLLTGGAMNYAAIEALEVVTKTGVLVPATSLCQFVRQAGAEQLEVYREIQRRGLPMPRELPIDAPYRAHVRGFTGIDKGRRKWNGYAELRFLGHHGDEDAYEYVPGEPRGRILSFLVDAAAIAVLAERQASAGATVVALGQALADDVVGNVNSFIGVIPRNDEEAIAFLKNQCSTDCGGSGSDGTYLEVAESEDLDRRQYVEAVIFSTRDGLFSRLEPRAEQPATDLPPRPDFVSLTQEGGIEVQHVFEAMHAFDGMRCTKTKTGPADDFYTFAAAGSSKPVVSLPSGWLLQKNAYFAAAKQRFCELMPGLAW